MITDEEVTSREIFLTNQLDRIFQTEQIENVIDALIMQFIQFEINPIFYDKGMKVQILKHAQSAGIEAFPRMWDYVEGQYPNLQGLKNLANDNLL
jgi:hypothetical protein